MQIVLELTELQKSILLIARICSFQRILPSELPKAVTALTTTKYQYFDLLRGCIENTFWDAGKEEIERNVVKLINFDLLETHVVRKGWSRWIPETSLLRRFWSNKREIKGFDEIGYLRLTKEGTRIASAIREGRRADMRPPQMMRTTIFVASAFGRIELDNLFEMELKPACESAGYTPFRVDLSEPHQTVSDRVLQAIRKCRCLIADLTYARPSVYFEIGVAHGMGIPLILTCRDDHYRGVADEARVHFDLEQYKISYWNIDGKGKFAWPKRMNPKERLKNVLAGA